MSGEMRRDDQRVSRFAGLTVSDEPCACRAGPCPHYPYQTNERSLQMRRGQSGLPRDKEVYLLRRFAERYLGSPLPPAPPRRRPRPPDVGPGEELRLLLRELGLRGRSGCYCASLARGMNAWGVAGCRERRGEIVAHLRRAQARAGWVEKVKAAALAVASGLAFKLDPLDPAPGLLDEALRRAEAKASQGVVGVVCHAVSARRGMGNPPVPRLTDLRA